MESQLPHVYVVVVVLDAIKADGNASKSLGVAYTTETELEAVRAQLRALPRSEWDDFSREQRKLLLAREIVRS